MESRKYLIRIIDDCMGIIRNNTHSKSKALLLSFHKNFSLQEFSIIEKIFNAIFMAFHAQNMKCKQSMVA